MSDNSSHINKEIIDAIFKVNKDFQDSYGKDEYSLKLQYKLSKIFEKDVKIFLTSTGTAANSLSLSSLVNPYEVIFCSNEAHILTDECGAPEFFTHGARLLPIQSFEGKISNSILETKIKSSLFRGPHQQKAGCISITQATECGTVYNIEDLKQIAYLGSKYNLPIHLDGARFANSLSALNCKPAEITWKVGVDVMSFGATKNGALCGEIIIFFNHKFAENFDYLHKRAGQLMSKSRFFSSQLLAYLENDLWLKNARHANDMAQKLMKIFNKFDLKIIYPVQINELFVKLPIDCAEYLKDSGGKFYSWSSEELEIFRFVTSWATTNEHIQNFDHCITNYFNTK